MRPQTINQIYYGYRFLAHLPELPPDHRIIGLAQLYTDVFSGDLYLGKAHTEGTTPLGILVKEISRLDVYLLPRDKTMKLRRIPVRFDTSRWIPLNLDASEGGVAMEWTILEKPTYGRVEDLLLSECPPEILIP